jgi:peptidyl-prolyl cis-trans isomerase B (cyclophilin B)
MQRRYPLLLIFFLLLAVIGIAATRIVLPAEPTVQPFNPPAPPTVMARDGDPAVLSRQITLPDQVVVERNVTLEPAIGPFAVRGTTPPVGEPEHRLRLPAVADGAGRLSLSSLGAPADWMVLLDDDFQDPNSDAWGLGTAESGSAELGDGKLLITAQEGWMFSVYPSAAPPLADGFIAASFSLEGGGSAGVVAQFRKDSGGQTMYTCGANSTGAFACYKMLQGEWSLLTSGQNEATEPDATTLIALQVLGDQLVLSINDVEVATFTDDDLSSGFWGLYADASTSTTTATFTHVQIAAPVPDPATATPTARPSRPLRTPTVRPGQPSRTPTARPSPPVRTPTRVVSTPSPTPERGQAGQVIVDNDFENGAAGTWRTGRGTYSAAEVRDGALVLSVDRPGVELISYPTEARDLADGSIQARLRIAGTSGRAGVFARFEQTDGGEWSMYFCGLDNTGGWSCSKQVEDQSMSLGKGQPATSSADENNEITLSVVGRQFSFQVNGEEVLRVNDGTLARGIWGVWASADDAPVAASFDRVTISSAAAPSTSSVTPSPGTATSGSLAVVETSRGSFTIRLTDDPALSGTVRNFKAKVASGFYDGLAFHRVEDWVVQGGDPIGNGTGGGSMPGEYNDDTFDRGSVGMAARTNHAARVNDAQWFVVKEDSPHLDGNYPNFGQVIDGMDVVDSLQRGDTIERITISGAGDEGEPAREPIGLLHGQMSGYVVLGDSAFPYPRVCNDGGCSPALLALPAGRLAAVLPGTPTPGSAPQDALDDIRAAYAATGAAQSYDFNYQYIDPLNGPAQAKGQYVAPDKAHLNADDPAHNAREAIIWGEEIFVKDVYGQYRAYSRRALNDDKVPAAEMVRTLADKPNILESFSDFMNAVAQVDDRGEVLLGDTVARHYTFVLDGTKMMGEVGAPQLIGSGAIDIDRSSNHIVALALDIDLSKYLSVVFGGLMQPTATATPVVGTPTPAFHLLYTLQLSNFDAPARFERPDVVGVMHTAPAVAGSPLAVPADQPAAPGQVVTPRPTSTPTAHPDATAAPALPDAVNGLIDETLDTMLNKLDTYHLDLEMDQDRIDESGSETITRLTQQADVENPDRLDMLWQAELSEDGDRSVARLRVIRSGDDVYYRNSRNGNHWQKFSVEDVGEDSLYLTTVIDMRPFMASAQLLPDAVHDGVTAHHIAFTVDVQQVVGEDTDLSGLNAGGVGEIWIDAQGGQLLEMKWHYLIDNPDNGARLAYQYDGIYSAFNEPVNIQPPNVQ